MTDLHLFSATSKNSSQLREGINEQISLDIPSKQRSCAAVNTPSACVNKAVHHIKDLEVKVEETLQWNDNLYLLETVSRDREIRNVEEAEKSWLSVSSELKVEQPSYLKDIQPLKQKTTAVLAEVTELVTRLEKERKEAQEGLEFERRRKKKLYLYADNLSLWRLQQLPIAVQKEWENYSEDIAELQWHFEEKKQQLHDAVNQLTKIESANAKILENIEFMKKYSPLLGEKLAYETESMEEIKKKYEQTKAVYDIVHVKLVNAIALSEELTEECKKKRKSMSEQLQSAEEMLNSLRKAIKDIDILYADLCAKIKENMGAILQQKKHLEYLIKQEARTKADVQSWQDKARRLSLKIAEQESENKTLTDEYLEEVKDIESTKTRRDSDIEDLKRKLRHYLQEIKSLEDESKRIYGENGDFLQKFRDSSRRKVGYQAEIQVLHKNIRRLEEHLKRVTKEFFATELGFDDVKTKLDELSQNIIKERLRFKNLQDNVKKQIKDEVSAWKLTQKRVKALQLELAKRQRVHDKLQEKIKKKLAELDRLVAEQTELLAKNKEKHKYLIEEIENLKRKIQELDEKEKIIKEDLDEQKNCFQKLLKDIQGKYLDISNQLIKVNEDIAKYKKQIEKVTVLNQGTQNLVNVVEKCLAGLRRKYDKIKSKEQNAQTLVDFLHERLDCVEKKVKKDNRIFEGRLWKRQQDLKAKERSLIEATDENLRLAQEYQMLQLCYLNRKNELMDFYEHKVQAEAALRDQQQFSRLQRKLHRALVKYFKLQALHSQAGLAKFQAASHENAQKILAVQRGLSEAVGHADIFLKSLTDGSST
ncbi:coiled-coil domain-containing protein 178 isoform X1 [Anolis carolinensis]|uniref:coiled-coil domain-containing protein 178 isoform X1 n=1 Tax=Anolis carolinensis TaxID=28377 RepID=UPI002F2B40DF